MHRGFVAQAPKLRKPRTPRAPRAPRAPRSQRTPDACDQHASDTVLDAAQRDVVTRALEANTVISGSAGTGKSAVLRQVIQELPKLSTVVAGPTGVAATNVGGTTLHSVLGLHPDAENGDLDALQPQLRVMSKLKKIDHIVIDEISMVSPNLFRAADKLFRLAKLTDAPFGGAHVVLCGDFLQLPPVGRASSGAKYCFQTPAWAELAPEKCKLKRSYRSEDADLTALLASVRVGEYPASVFQTLERAPDPKSTLLRCTNREVDNINRMKYAALGDCAEATYEATITGLRKDAANQVFQTVPQVLKLKVATRVMLTRNIDVPAGLVNGATGEVVDMLEEEGRTVPMVDFIGVGIRAVPLVEWTVTELGQTICRVTQLPLRHAWAITIHKAQGASLPSVDVDLYTAFDTGQAYVALSRARSLATLSVRGASPSRVMCCGVARKHEED